MNTTPVSNVNEGHGRIISRLRFFFRDRRGLAGIEFALVAGVLCILLLNGVELARYAYTVMQVQNAAQIGAQSVWKACDPTKELPAMTLCPNVKDTITLAIQSTSLGKGVELNTNSPTEAYYCLNQANALILAAEIPLGIKPTDCSVIAGAKAGQPGDYIQVDVTYQFKPLFLDFTIERLFGPTITKSTFMRLL